MKRFFLLLMLVLGMLLVSCELFENDHEHDDFSIEISPDDPIIAVGEELVLEVKIEEVEDLFAMSVEIVFDGAVLELSAQPLIIGDAWGEDYISTSVIEIDRLNVAIGLMDNGGVEELEGNFRLFQLKLTGKAAGETMVNIHNLNLYDQDGNPVDDFDEIEIDNAVVIVQ